MILLDLETKSCCFAWESSSGRCGLKSFNAEIAEIAEKKLEKLGVLGVLGVE
jgi:hypothetical protein